MSSLRCTGRRSRQLDIKVSSVPVLLTADTVGLKIGIYIPVQVGGPTGCKPLSAYSIGFIELFRKKESRSRLLQHHRFPSKFKSDDHKIALGTLTDNDLHSITKDTSMGIARIGRYRATVSLANSTTTGIILGL